MLFYILVCLFACIFIFLYSKIESKNLAFIFKWTSFLILFLPLALRYNIGVDYINYVNHIINGTYENEFEIGWVIFIKFLLLFNIDMQWFFVIPAFLSLLIVFNFAEKKYTWIVVGTYTLTIYLFSYTTIRQEFAISLLLLAIKFYLKNNTINLKTILFILLAACFHKSAILGAVFLLSGKNIKFSNYYFNLFILFIIFLLYFAHIGNFFMANFIKYTPYAYYEFNSFNRENTNSIFGILFRFVTLFSILFFTKKPTKNSIYMNKLYNVTLIFIFSLAFSQILYADVHIFGRLIDLYNLAFIFSLLYIYMNNAKNLKLAIFIILFLLSIFYFYATYKGIKNSEGVGIAIIPYQSIFER